jgi:hypothetical protein
MSFGISSFGNFSSRLGKTNSPYGSNRNAQLAAGQQTVNKASLMARLGRTGNGQNTPATAQASAPVDPAAAAASQQETVRNTTLSAPAPDLSAISKQMQSLSTLLDGTSRAANVVKAAQMGASSISALLQNAETIARNALAAVDQGGGGGGGSSTTTLNLASINETLVNTTTSGRQGGYEEEWGTPKGVSLSDGSYVTTWTSVGQDGSGGGVYAQKYSASGAKTGGEFRINTTTLGHQYESDITALANGNYVVTWTSDGNSQDTSGGGIFARVFDANNNALTGEFKVNTTTTGTQTTPTITGLDNGDFVVSWQSASQDGSGTGVYAQRFNSAGAAQGAEFRVNQETYSDQRRNQITSLEGGGFVVTWDSYAQDGSGWGVYGRRYDASGTAQGSEFRVSTLTSSEQRDSSVSRLSGGGFVVSFTDYSGEDQSGAGIFFQVYDADGTQKGSQKQANTFNYYNQYTSSVTNLADGGFVVSWKTDYNYGGWDSTASEGGATVQSASYNGSVNAQRFDSNGNKVESEFKISQANSNANLRSSALFSLKDGGFAALYTALDGNDQGVRIRQFNGEEVTTGGGGGAGGGTSAAVQRRNYAELFEEIRGQLDILAASGLYDNTNLLQGQNFSASLGDGKTLSINGRQLGSSGLNLTSALTAEDWETNTEINTAITTIVAARTQVQTALSDFNSKAANLTSLQNQGLVSSINTALMSVANAGTRPSTSTSTVLGASETGTVPTLESLSSLVGQTRQQLSSLRSGMGFSTLGSTRSRFSFGL